MWRLILKHLFKMKVIITTDHDGEERWRFAFRDPLGGYRCKSIARWVKMYKDGTCDDGYVQSWVAK